MKNGDLGVENASDESLIEALKELRTEAQDSKEDEYSHGDLAAFGLSGHGSAELRRAICDELRIGCSNVKTLIKKLNYYGIKRGDLQAAIEKWRKT